MINIYAVCALATCTALCYAASMRKRCAPPSKIDAILGRSSARLRLGERIRRYRLWQRWRDVVGTAVADHARPARWQGRTLVVRVDHPAWVQELSFLKLQMLEKLREAFPEQAIREIRFEVGELPAEEAPGEPPAPTPPRPLAEEEVEFIEQAAKEIPDADVREAARRAMQRSFGSEKRRRDGD
jgi:hypothetical protein